MLLLIAPLTFNNSSFKSNGGEKKAMEWKLPAKEAKLKRGHKLF